MKPAVYIRVCAVNSFEVPPRPERKNELEQNDNFARDLTVVVNKLLGVDPHRVFIELESPPATNVCTDAKTIESKNSKVKEVVIEE